MNQPLSSKEGPAGSIALLAILALACLIFFYFYFPIFKIIGGLGWKETPCVIATSWAEGSEGSGEKGFYNHVNITYTYEVAGQTYTGKRHHFVTGSTPGRAGKVSVVARYPVGTKTVCYVNPSDPHDAVIDRGFTGDMTYGAIAGGLAGLCVWGMFYSVQISKGLPQTHWEPATLRKTANHGSAVHSSTDHVSAAAVTEAGARDLQPDGSPVLSMAGFSLLAVVLNYFVLPMPFEGHGGVWATVFSVNFLVFGAFTIGANAAAVYYILAYFNPRAHLRIDPGVIVPGDPLTLAWRVDGRTSVLTDFRIWLEGTEEAAYEKQHTDSRGHTSTYMTTDTEVFATIELTKTVDATEFATGQVRVTLPRDAMHSLETGHNKILWKIRVQGSIARWPDMKSDYPVVILPLRKGVSQ